MRTLVQLSDLHFGATLEPTLGPIRDAVHAIAPDLVIVSGDLTQRAREEQFQSARRFLEGLPAPQLIVPGNHDVPLYNVLQRFAQPLTRYRRHITRDLAPLFIDDEVAVVGINSARSLVFKGGRINARQIAHASAQFATATSGQARIVVTHHPLHIPPGLEGVRVVGGARRAVRGFAAAGVDLVVAGHLHLVHASSTRTYDTGTHPHYDAPLLIAGTATSTRARGETNSFFVIRVDDATLHVETRRWSPERCEFVMAEVRTYRRQRPRVSEAVA